MFNAHRVYRIGCKPATMLCNLLTEAEEVLTMLQLFDAIGLVGVVIILSMYSLLQTERLSADTISYSAWNLLGSILIAISLIFGNFNLSAMLIEIFWIFISLYGLQKAWRKRKPALE